MPSTRNGTASAEAVGGSDAWIDAELENEADMLAEIAESMGAPPPDLTEADSVGEQRGESMPPPPPALPMVVTPADVEAATEVAMSRRPLPFSVPTGLEHLIKGSATAAPVTRSEEESLLTWNAAGWYCGDLRALTDPQRVMRAQRRYDALAPVIASTSGAPTYALLSEVSGTMAQYGEDCGLRAWWSSHGYDSTYVPGPPCKSDFGPLGGILIAWRTADVRLLNAKARPKADTSQLTVSARFVHRLLPRDAKPALVALACTAATAETVKLRWSQR